MGVLVGTLLLGGVTLLGLELLRSTVNSDDDGSVPSPEAAPTTTSVAAPPPAPEPAPVAISAATDFDPPPNGSGDENPQDTQLAIDGDSSTSWTTMRYFDPIELQKPGVGIYLDLGAAVAVSGLNLTLVSPDSDIEIRAAPEAAAEPPGTIDEWTVVAEVAKTEQAVPVSLDTPVTTRYVLVWFTRLPPDGGDFRGGVSEVEVLG